MVMQLLMTQSRALKWESKKRSVLLCNSSTWGQTIKKPTDEHKLDLFLQKTTSISVNDGEYLVIQLGI